MFRHVLAGAGGWGDPLERDPAAVLRDVRNELLSPQKALADYGVVVDTATWAVDAAATARRREEIRRARGWTGDAQGAVARASNCCAARRVRPWPSPIAPGVDIGGTFTDIVLLGSDGTVHTKKISSGVGNYAQAIVDGLSEVLRRDRPFGGSAIDEIRHGTTVASSAILEHKGARVEPHHHQGLPRRAGDPHAADAQALRHRLD